MNTSSEDQDSARTGRGAIRCGNKFVSHNPPVNLAHGALLVSSPCHFLVLCRRSLSYRSEPFYASFTKIALRRPLLLRGSLPRWLLPRFIHNWWILPLSRLFPIVFFFPRCLPWHLPTRWHGPFQLATFTTLTCTKAALIHHRLLRALLGPHINVWQLVAIRQTVLGSKQSFGIFLQRLASVFFCLGWSRPRSLPTITMSFRAEAASFGSRLFRLAGFPANGNRLFAFLSLYPPPHQRDRTLSLYLLQYEST